MIQQEIIIEMIAKMKFINILFLRVVDLINFNLIFLLTKSKNLNL
jgi:hypothetical protein